MTHTPYELCLVLGGSRSGKTSFAEQYALGLPRAQAPGNSGCESKYVYVATCPPGLDPEMDERIDRHRSQRSQRFITVENELDLLGIATKHEGATILLDCLTLWLSSCQYRGLSTDKILANLREDLGAARAKAHWVIVSNEVGMGIVPLGRETREFRDLAGWANQLVAELASQVYLVVAGITLALKSSPTHHVKSMLPGQPSAD